MNGDNDGTFECNCGADICRGVGVYQGNFFKLPKEIQMKYVKYLDGWFREKYEKEEFMLCIKTLERVCWVVK